MKQKFINFLKQNQLLLLMLMGGIAFMSLTGRWRSYGEPYVQFYEICKNFGKAEIVREDHPKEVRENGKNWFGLLKKSEKDALIEGEDTQNGVDGTTEEGNQSLGTEGQTDAALEEQTPKEVVWQKVDDSYFDDALFIGDSRIVGLQDYGQLQDHATFYASTGLNIFRLLSARIAMVEGQRKKVSVEEALGQKQFGKIYLMVGINELDIGTVERFEETYKATVERIRELQPNAIIYIQSIMKVTTKRASRGDFVKNEGIVERNDAIMKLADNETIFYLDVNEAVCDESGGMNPAYTSDGIHLKVKYIPLWRDYLKSHAIVKE